MKKILIFSLMLIIVVPMTSAAGGRTKAHLQQEGRSLKIDVLGFVWGSGQPSRRQLATSAPPRGVKKIGLLIEGKQGILLRLFKNNSQLGNVVLTVNQKPGQAVQFKLLNLTILQARDPGGGGPGKMRDPSDGDPPKVLNRGKTGNKMRDPSGDPDGKTGKMRDPSDGTGRKLGIPKRSSSSSPITLVVQASMSKVETRKR